MMRDLKKHRILVLSGVLLALVAVTVWKVVERSQEEDVFQGEREQLWSPVDTEAIDRIRIHHPDSDEAVVVERKALLWSVTAPVKAEADQDALREVVERLGNMEVSAVAATKKANHGALQVTKDEGIRVEAFAGDKGLLDIWVGAYRGGNTMVRLQGQERVLAMRGSFRFTFDKTLKEWRNREVYALDSDRVRSVTIEEGKVTLGFAKKEGTWAQVAGKAVKDFDPDKLASIASTLANLSASDFAAPDLGREEAGLGPEGSGASAAVARIVFVTESEPQAGADEASDGADDGAAPDASEQADASEKAKPGSPTSTTEHVLLIGKRLESGRYVQPLGSDVIYVLSEDVAQQLLPNAEALKKDPKADKSSPEDAMGDMGGAGFPPGMLPPGMQMPGG